MRTLVEAAADGWWYRAPLPDGRTVAAFFVEPNFYVEQGVGLGEQLRAAPLTCARVGRARLVESNIAHVSSSIRKRVAGDGWAAVGDAAASYDPLSGYGITKALQDASAVADAIARGDLDSYASNARSPRMSVRSARTTRRSVAGRRRRSGRTGGKAVAARG